MPEISICPNTTKDGKELACSTAYHHYGCRCEACRKWVSVQNAERRGEALDKGLCTNCFAKPQLSYSQHCEECRSARRERLLQKRFGIDLDTYRSMLSNQDGGCGICEESPNRDKALDVDHNHDTGEVRGLLCNTCNRGLGMLGDDVATLKSAIDYLEGQNGSE